MRCFALILVFAALSTASPAPEPKKYKPETKDTKTNASLTNDEKLFLREVEAKFGIKSDVPVDDEKTADKETTKLIPKGDLPKVPFPAVIAIEIVNDTDSKSKGKRTIDANLGYGYRTNNGYSYSYFGKSSQDKGKFMIYPYSQEDIPAANANNHRSGFANSGYTTPSSNVEIQPSQAYELVPVKEEQGNSYDYKKPSTEFKSPYENVKGLQSPPPPYKQSQNPPSTLYTTYNGENFSGLSSQFPSVMPNYYVDSSQLLQHPEYQNAGLTQDHLRTHGSQLEKPVVPVLVLRIPSSYIKNPSAELYADLPQNYPLSQYLNNVNLQDLVNQYFSKIGYHMAPQIMSYSHSSISAPAKTSAPAATSVSHYEPQRYAHPHVQPSYTQADYSGVQYSAVQPVMATYPSKYSVPQYYMTSQTQQIYQQPIQQQQYEYQYQYVPQQNVQQQYYQQQIQESPGAQQATDQETSVHDTPTNIQYAETQATAQEHPQSTQEYEVPKTSHYRQHQLQSHQYETVQTEYGIPKEDKTEYSANDSDPTKVQVTSYDAAKPQYGPPQGEQQQQYYTSNEAAQKDTLALYPSSPQSETVQQYNLDPQSGLSQSYFYQKQVGEDSASKTIVISENYPSKDHTQVTVLPVSYRQKKPSKSSAQSVNYVTPSPFSSKYQSQYNIMVPQTVLGPKAEKVSYVNSHSIPSHYLQSATQYSPEEEYTLGTSYVPSRGSQKPPSYPRNYHTQPKRMAKPDNKQENPSPSSSSSKKRNEKKKSS